MNDRMYHIYFCLTQLYIVYLTKTTLLLLFILVLNENGDDDDGGSDGQ